MTVTAEPNLDPEDLEGEFDDLEAEEEIEADLDEVEDDDTEDRVDPTDETEPDDDEYEPVDDADLAVDDADLDDADDVDESDEIENENEIDLDGESADEVDTDTAPDADIEDDAADDEPEIPPPPMGQNVSGLLVAKRDESSTRSEPAAAPIAEPDGSWSFAQARSVLTRVAAVLWVFGLIGFGLGYSRGGSHVVRTEFVYTLDQSIPDGFLREDRRLLTQVVTLRSDAVLGPVGDRFDLSVDELRTRIDVETVELSEVLRLEVTDPDRDTAAEISQAVIDQYLLVSSTPLSSEESTSLRQQRTEVLDALAAADAELALARGDEAAVNDRRAATERRVDLEIERISRLKTDLDNAVVAQPPSRAQVAQLEARLAQAEEDLGELQAELVALTEEQAANGQGSATRTSLTREVERLEQDLATIDQELARRELGPLVASPVRELAEPTSKARPALVPATQGAALGLLIGLPVAGLIGYRARRRQLWLG